LTIHFLSHSDNFSQKYNPERHVESFFHLRSTKSTWFGKTKVIVETNLLLHAMSCSETAFSLQKEQGTTSIIITCYFSFSQTATNKESS
jgi:hypothetical protein